MVKIVICILFIFIHPYSLSSKLTEKKIILKVWLSGNKNYRYIGPK